MSSPQGEQFDEKPIRGAVRRDSTRRSHRDVWGCWQMTSGEDLRRRTRISRSMSEEALMRSLFGRALLSMLQRDLSPDRYDSFVTLLRRLRSQRSTSTTGSPPSSVD